MTTEQACSFVVLHLRRVVVEKHTLSTEMVLLLHWRLVSVRVTGTWMVLQSVAGSSQHSSTQTVLQPGA
jgi:hypothetical protein